MRIVVWNRFLEVHSGRSAGEVVGKSLFDAFPELPRAWLDLMTLSASESAWIGMRLLDTSSPRPRNSRLNDR